VRIVHNPGPTPTLDGRLRHRVSAVQHPLDLVSVQAFEILLLCPRRIVGASEPRNRCRNSTHPSLIPRTRRHPSRSERSPVESQPESRRSAPPETTMSPSPFFPMGKPAGVATTPRYPTPNSRDAASVSHHGISVYDVIRRWVTTQQAPNPTSACRASTAGGWPGGHGNKRGWGACWWR
jgi:hypothetical protein